MYHCIQLDLNPKRAEEKSEKYFEKVFLSFYVFLVYQRDFQFAAFRRLHDKL